MKSTKKESNNKGFTLVELIVVIVILAILAAILVPALLGYIDRAKDSQYVLNAKSVLTASQAEMSSLYGADKPASDITSRVTTVVKTADIPSGASALVKCKTDWPSGTGVTITHDMYTIAKVIYIENGKYCVYDGSSWQSFNEAADAATALGESTLPSATGSGWYKIK